MAPGTVTLRSLETLAEFEACVELQRETWGRDFSGCVPAAVLMVVHKVGGVAAGAFDDENRLLGFVFGITGFTGGRPLHWSHMLAVRPACRGAGLGVRLKLYQRQLLLDNGVRHARWTYDPLVAKNAHINLNRLGVGVVEYIENLYGDSNSPLHAGLGTDRFVVEWRLDDDRVARVVAGLEPPASAAFAAAPLATDAPGAPGSSPAGRVRIEIPADIHAVLTGSPPEAARWRTRTRRALVGHLERGYRVAAFYRDAASGRCFYGLTPPGQEEHA